MIALLLGGCTEPSYTGPASDHFDGERFFNPGEPFDKDWTDLWRYFLEREPGEWARNVEAPPGPAPAARVDHGSMLVTVVGHATTLIQVDGLNLLTDPIWSERASPFGFIGPKRFTPPGIAFDELPKIDAVLIGHNHFDHLDLPTLERLYARFDPVFVVGLGQSALLKEQGIARTVELDWWQAWDMPNGCKLWGAQSKHWTGRLPGDRNLSLWLSYVIETRGGPVYFAGDTGYGAHFSAARKRFGPMRHALLPIGAYNPRWLTAYQHMDPAEAVRAHRDLDSQSSLAIHFGTFELADDGQVEPPQDLAKARAAMGLDEAAFRAPEFGRGYDVPPLQSSSGCRS
ncbi:MAG: MBL fold metallo-hydrolase [Panacagrimonas sp.]